MTTVIVNAPATVGNVGPGFDILGLAVEGLSDRFEFNLIDDDDDNNNNKEIITVSGRDQHLVPLDPEENSVTLSAWAMQKKMGSSQKFQVHIHRQLPISGGLGGSAAASLAGACGAAALFGREVDDRSLMEAALVGEQYVAGRHLDNIAPCLFGGLVLIRGLSPISVDPFTCHPYWISLVTPQQKLQTKESRDILPKMLPREVWIPQMANAVALVQGLVTGNDQLIRDSVIDRFAEPKRGELIKGFGQAKNNALEAGALGCSISGGGPTCFAISVDESIAKEVLEAMAQGIGEIALKHVGRISPTGVKIDLLSNKEE